MTRKDTGQLSFDMTVAEPAKQRSKRLRVPAPPATDRRVPKQRSPRPGGLVAEAVLARCGFCGTRLTVHGEGSVCPSCGAIVARPDRDD